MSMSTLAGMYYMQMQNPPGQDVVERTEMDAENENINQESDEDNTSCSASEIGCDLSLSTSNNNNISPTPNSHSTSSRNKRKNFKPRNILEYAGSDEDDGHHGQRSKYTPSEHHQQSNTNGVGVGVGRFVQNISLPSGMDLHGIMEAEGDSSDTESGRSCSPPRERLSIPTSAAAAAVDGPLDLTGGEVGGAGGELLLSKNQRKGSLAVRNLLNNFHNNNHLEDPTSYLSHHPMVAAANMAAAAAAAAAAANSIGMDLRMGHTSTAATTSSSGEGSPNNNNNHHPNAPPMLHEFMGNTMKELFCLYGISTDPQGKISKKD